MLGFLTGFVVAIPFVFAVNGIPGINAILPAVGAGMLNMVVIPGVALLLGVVPFLRNSSPIRPTICADYITIVQPILLPLSFRRAKKDESAGVGVDVDVLQFLDLCDCDGVSSFSLEYRASGLHVLSDKGHHLFPLVRIGHVRRDGEIYQPGLAEDDDRRAMLNAIPGALQAEAGSSPRGILDGTSEVPNRALDGHRFGIGVHFSTLTRERRADEEHGKSCSKD